MSISRFIFLFIGCCVSAADWPTYRGDASRSGVSTEKLIFPLKQAWAHQPLHGPRPAWRGPAKRDPYNKIDDMKHRQLFDHAFHVIADAKNVYFGSSADDQVHCLNATTGKERWTYFTEGPVRLAPTLHGRKLFVGSDDGHAYCLSVEGELIWRKRLGPRDYRIAGNNRIISAWPLRTGILVRDGIAYAGAGMFPSEGVHVVAFNASDGAERWRSTQTDFPAQGYLLVSENRVYVSAGRNNPVVFNRANGKRLHVIGGGGGTYALLTGDTLVFGPGRKGQLGLVPKERKDAFATFPGANQMIVTRERIFLQVATGLSALDRVLYLTCEGERQQLNALRGKLGKQLAQLRKQKSPDLSKVQDQLIAASKRLNIVNEGMRTDPTQLSAAAKEMAEIKIPGLMKAAEQIGVKVANEIQNAAQVMKAAEAKGLPGHAAEMAKPMMEAANGLMKPVIEAEQVAKRLRATADQAEQMAKKLKESADQAEQEAKAVKTKEAEQVANRARKTAKQAMQKAKSALQVAQQAEALRKSMEPIARAAQEAERLAEVSKVACVFWRSECKQTHSLVLTGNALFAGGNNEVGAYSEYDGKSIWRGSVHGLALGLAVAHGRLLVSTEKGTINCFTSK